MVRTAAVLISAHLISDFLFQPDEMVRLKKRKIFLILHAAIHAFVTYVFMQNWVCWFVPAIVFVVHLAIDAAKQRCEDTDRAFIIDQSFHVGSLIALAWLMIDRMTGCDFTGSWFKVIIVLGGFVATVIASGVFIGKFTGRRWSEITSGSDGLEDGGKTIGYLERFLVFMFILMGQPAAIGFLVAAKSVLRFRETKDHKHAEYILVGTLLSFAMAVGLASLTKWALNL